MKPRRAFTLVELLTTMTMGSSIMLLAIGLLHQSMSMSKIAKVRWENDQSLARLAQQFRGDVHSASVVISVSANTLSLQLADNSTVTYKCEAATVTWEKISPNSEVARDVFRINEGCVAEFSNPIEPNRVELQIERRLESTEFTSPIDLRVVAAVGRWQQLERVGGLP